MSEPKPFACMIPNCGMTFTNEDHLHVHTKKHDMVLQLGIEQKNVFVADQTPTPTRFIRNCEEVGLFQDLQNVNPFDEGFKRAMETKSNLLCPSEGAVADDVLHTPQMVFPPAAGAGAGPGTVREATNQNITISRSSSDETGSKYERTTISKLTNQVTTISRVIEKQDNLDICHEDKEKVSYTNNVIKIHSNLEIRKDHIDLPMKMIGNLDHREPIMSQKSIDYVVDSLTSETSGKTTNSKKRIRKKSQPNDYEVLLKLPNSSKMIKMKAVSELDEQERVLKPETKEKLKSVLTSKVFPPKVGLGLPVAGTLHPVTLVSAVPVFVTSTVKKVPIPLNSSVFKVQSDSKKDEPTEYFDINEIRSQRSAASKRYRERLKRSMESAKHENKQLKEMNQRLMAENSALKSLIMEHVKKCADPADLSNINNQRTAPTQKRPSIIQSKKNINSSH